MSALILTDETRATVQRLMAYAAEHVQTLQDSHALALGLILDAPGDNPNFVCDLPIGHHCVFTYEMQVTGKHRHLSVSLARKNKMPNPAVVHEIAKLFGFTDGLHGREVYTWKENIPHGKAINLLEPVGE